jgi:methionyl aminopeptidase
VTPVLRRGREIEIKSTGELTAMRAAGLVVARTLTLLIEHAKPGVSTLELDELAENNIRDAGAVPSFKGYHGFPASICASVNEQVVHGIPARDQVLSDGDLISIDWARFWMVGTATRRSRSRSATSARPIWHCPPPPGRR